MIVSNGLASIPLLSSTDSTRLQMASKQIKQSCSLDNTRRPYIIGSDYKYLTGLNNQYKFVSDVKGSILFKNDLFIICLFNDEKIELFNIEKYKVTSNKFCTELLFCRDVGDFKEGDILYEYSGSIENVPAYGINTNVLFYPFFGFNYEDSIVISESFKNNTSVKLLEKKTIPIYVDNLGDEKYPGSKYKYFPEINQRINNSDILSVFVNKGDGRDYIFDIINNNMDIKNNIGGLLISEKLNNTIFKTKLDNSKVINLKIHKIQKNLYLYDKKFAKHLELLRTDYTNYIKDQLADLGDLFSEENIKCIIEENYIMGNYKSLDFPKEKLVYVIEFDLLKELETQPGDKFSNRYANKGVVSLILPDELMPVNLKTGERVDYIIDPSSVYGRMNFGQLIEGIISKVIKSCEEKIKENKKNKDIILNILDKLASLSEIIYKNKIYSNSILNIKNNLDEFIKSIELGGLYFEVPNFCKFDLVELVDFIEKEFDISHSNDFIFKKELFEYMKTKMNIDIEIPDNDMIFNNLFNSNSYILKLMQFANSKFSARDFGSYKITNRQPSKKNIDKESKSSRIGNMEFDGLITHNAINVVKEFRKIKSDSTEETKLEMIRKILLEGEYVLSSDKKLSYTKLLIDSIMKFLNSE